MTSQQLLGTAVAFAVVLFWSGKSLCSAQTVESATAAMQLVKFWGPDAPKQWHAAYVASGGASGFIATPPVPNSDGHELIFVGRDLWVPAVESFLKRVGLD